jgi:ubiquinone biosynthesis protein
MSTIGAYFRLARVGWVLVREGVVSALPTEDMPPAVGFAKSMLEPLARFRAK